MELKVSNIHFAYTKETHVLEDISFSVSPGETLCVLGASGSGKSTLLKILGGLLPSNKRHTYSGTVSFNTSHIDTLKDSGRLSYMFQEPALMPNLSVRANVELPSKIYNRSFHTSVDDTIQVVGLSASTNKFPRDLSGGMKTRTALARSFITQPALLLLDEPFSSLDLGWRHSLYQELKTLQKRDNTAVVMVTHDVNESIELADKIIVLNHKGQQLQDFTVTESNKEEIRNKANELILQDHFSFLNTK